MLIRLCCFAAFLFLLAVGLRAQQATPAMESAFLGKLKAAVVTKDYDGFSDLVCHDGRLNSEMRKVVDQLNHDSFQQICANKNPDFGFAPVSPKQLSTFTYKGVVYETNLKLIEVLKINFPQPSVGSAGTPTGMTFPLGLKNGRLLIAQTMEKAH